MPETDPLGKAPGERGSKLDAGKIAVYQGLFAYFPAACAAVANVSTIGAKKYSWKGWEDVPDGINRYSDALCRHILQESLEGPWDSGEGGTGELHAAQVAWNAMARLELILREERDKVAAKVPFAPYGPDLPVIEVLFGHLGLSSIGRDLPIMTGRFKA